MNRISTLSRTHRKRKRHQRKNRRSTLEQLEVRQLLAGYLHNSAMPTDVSGKGLTETEDALLIANALNTRATEVNASAFFDTDGDGHTGSGPFS